MLEVDKKYILKTQEQMGNDGNLYHIIRYVAAGRGWLSNLCIAFDHEAEIEFIVRKLNGEDVDVFITADPGCLIAEYNDRAAGDIDHLLLHCYPDSETVETVSGYKAWEVAKDQISKDVETRGVTTSFKDFYCVYDVDKFDDETFEMIHGFPRSECKGQYLATLHLPADIIKRFVREAE